MEFNATVFAWNLPSDFDSLKRFEKKKYIENITGYYNEPYYVRKDLLEKDRGWYESPDFKDVIDTEDFWRVAEERLVPNCADNVLIGTDNFTLGTSLAAAMVILVLSLFKRRKRLFPNLFNGRGGVVYPVDFITDHNRRWLYGLVFVLLAYRTIDLMHSDYYVEIPAIMAGQTLKIRWLKVVLTIVNVLMVGFFYWPLFACIGLFKHIPANILGILYTIPWITDAVMTAEYTFPRCLDLRTLDTDNEDDTTLSDGLETVMSDVPQFIAYVILIIAFSVDLVRNLLKLCRKAKVLPQSFSKSLPEKKKKIRPKEEEAYLKYVRFLLRKKPEPPPKNFLERMKHRFTYKSVEGFKYSSRVACTVAMAAATLFFFVSQELPEVAVMQDSFNKILNSIDPQGANAVYIEMIMLPYYVMTGGDAMDIVAALHRIRSIIDLCFASVYLGFIGSLVIQCILMAHMIAMYRVNMRKLMRGRNTFHYKKYLNTSPTSKLVSQLRYSGYQIAYLIAGFHMLLVVIAVSCFVVGFFIVLPLIDHRESWLIISLKEYWPNILVGLGIYILQVLLVKFVFLQERGRYLALNNRRLYHVATLFFLLYNVLVGLFSILKRFVFSTLLGALLFCRMDRVLLIRGFERLDSGYKAYLGMLYVDLYHNHPVMRAFVQTLREAVAEAKAADRRRESTVLPDNFSNGEVGKRSSLGSTKVEKHIKKNVRNKWWKLVTLINNPTLVMESNIKRYWGERNAAYNKTEEDDEEDMDVVTKV